MPDKKTKFTNVYLFKKDLVKTFTNSNNNEFGIIKLQENEKETTFATFSTKLIKPIDFSKEEGKTFASTNVINEAEKDFENSPFIQVAIPSTGDLTVSIKNKETNEYRNEVVKVTDLFKDLVIKNKETIEWAKNAKANWVTSSSLKKEKSKEAEISLEDTRSIGIDDELEYQ